MENKEPVKEWVYCLTHKDYSGADKYVAKESDMVSIKSDEPQGGMYYKVIDGIVDAIDTINIDMKDSDTASVSITYKRYKKVSSVQYNDKDLSSLKDKYLRGEMDDIQFKDELNLIYEDSLKRTVLPSLEGSKVTKEFDVTVHSGKVQGVGGMLESLRSDMNIKSNLDVFERDVNSTINVILHE